MAVNNATGYNRTTNEPLDALYLNSGSAYASTTEVNSKVNITVRHTGSMFNVNGELYWYKDGVQDGDLILFSVASASYAKTSSGADRFEIRDTPNATVDTDKFLVSDSGSIKYRTGAEVLSDINAQPSGSYITSLTGEVTAAGPGAASATLLNSAVIGKVLTGLNVTGGTIVATDTILQAFGKAQNQITGLMGGATYQGVWNASTNSPTITSSTGTKGHYYVVNVAGSTNIDGITDWKIGDWIIFNGATWDKVDNTDAVSSVNGYVGSVSLVTGDILEGAGTIPGRPSQLFFTAARAQAAISSSATGLTYNSTTGVFTITSGYVIPTTTQETNWNLAYTQTRQWDGGATGLVAATGRTSLGLGTMAVESASNYYTTTQIQNFFSGASAMTGYNKSNWDTAYGWGNWAAGSHHIGTTNIVNNRASGAQTLTGVSIDGNAATATNVAASGVTGGAALSLTDDTNVTISQTGSTTALLAAKGLIMGWSGTLADSRITSAATWHAKQTAYTNLTTIGALANANGFLRQNGAGVFSYDTNIYLTGNQTITLSGHVTGSGATSISTTIANGVVTTAMMASANISQWTNNSGYITGYTETDTLGSVTNRGNTTSQDIVFSNGRKGLVGVYDAAQTQAIFAMDAAYVLTDGGASNVIGNLYGLAWSYNPDYGGVGNNPQSKAGLNHQLLLMQAGVTTIALGSGLWTSGAITTTSTISASNFSGTHSGSSSGTNTGDQDLSGLALRGLSNVNGVLSSTYGGAGSVNGILKANGSGTVSAAVAGDITSLISGTYLPLTAGSGQALSSDLYISQAGAASVVLKNTTGGTDLKNVRLRTTGTNFFIEGINDAFSSVLKQWSFNMSTGVTTLPDALNGTSLSMSGGGSFGGNVTLNNGQYYQAKRNTGSATLNVLGFESGTDDLIQVFSNSWKLRNTGVGDAANVIVVNADKRIMISGATDNGTDALQVAGSGLFTGNVRIDGENTYLGADATTVPRLGFVKKSGAQPFLGFAADPFTLKVSSGSTIDASNTFTTLLTVATSGAATFSSSVTASSLIRAGGTSTQSLMADGSTRNVNQDLRTTDNVTFNYITGTAGGGDSDLTLKNVITRGEQRSIANQLEMIKFTWKDNSKGVGERYGYGAQDLLGILPEAVYKVPGKTTYAVEYSMVHTVVLNEHTCRIQALEAKVKELELQLKQR